ncbi:hypothetical protein BV898_05480 [Hypsibius exemplaris]|uniref:Uncharacterized protein n=1 Tax=Hypsibius exemplaris TaxID=2072580 RepID=A0A1W0WZ00_HYPEX|nr:hypothetical protein BV898_05480 [Hypsibius exemplaris]
MWSQTATEEKLRRQSWMNGCRFEVTSRGQRDIGSETPLRAGGRPGPQDLVTVLTASPTKALLCSHFATVPLSS